MTIQKLRRETNDMDKELNHFNKVNANLGFVVDDLRTKQDQMQELIKKSRRSISKNDIYIRGFRNAVYWVVQEIDDYEQLKNSVHKNLFHYVRDQEQKKADVDQDIKKEYENQKRYLENSVGSLRKRLEKETAVHKEDNL